MNPEHSCVREGFSLFWSDLICGSQANARDTVFVTGNIPETHVSLLVTAYRVRGVLGA